MAQVMPVSKAVKMQLKLERANDSITHFLNEQIRDAVEAIEGEQLTDIVISASGHINHYQDGTREFLWKHKPVLVVRTRRTKDGDLEVYAEHNYNESFEITLSEADARVDGDVEYNEEDSADE